MTATRLDGLPSADALFGRTDSHVVPVDAGVPGGRPVPLHRDAGEAFLALREEARREGLDLAAASGFRGFGRQLAIWNAKASGARPVLDDDGRPLDVASLDDDGLLFAILRWSAFPGASRHHWGTDVDVIDPSALPPGEAARLVPAEFAPGGVFGPLRGWLDGLVARGSSLGFHRPYDRDRGGVAPEPWHLSHAPSARAFEEAFDASAFEALLADLDGGDVLLLDAMRRRSGEVFRRFVAGVAPPPPRA